MAGMNIDRHFRENDLSRNISNLYENKGNQIMNGAKICLGVFMCFLLLSNVMNLQAQSIVFQLSGAFDWGTGIFSAGDTYDLSFTFVYPAVAASSSPLPSDTRNLQAGERRLSL